MKLALFSSALLLSISTFAFQDGTYKCGSRENFFEATYKVTTLTVNGVKLPHFDITKNYYANPADTATKDRTFQISGIATVFNNDEGQETLILGNIMVDLTAGRITCKQ